MHETKPVRAKNSCSTPSRASAALALAAIVTIPGSCLGAAAESSAPAKDVDLTQLPLETLMEIEVPKVYSASKFEQKTTEAPASITVVGADEVKRYGYQTLGDLL